MISIETIQRVSHQRPRLFFKKDGELFYIGEGGIYLNNALRNIEELKLYDYKWFQWDRNPKNPIEMANWILDNGCSILKTRRYCLHIDPIYKNFYWFIGYVFKDGKNYMSFAYQIYSKELYETLQGIVKNIPLIRKQNILRK